MKLTDFIWDDDCSSCTDSATSETYKGSNSWLTDFENSGASNLVSDSEEWEPWSLDTFDAWTEFAHVDSHLDYEAWAEAEVVEIEHALVDEDKKKDGLILTVMKFLEDNDLVKMRRISQRFDKVYGPLLPRINDDYFSLEDELLDVIPEDRKEDFQDSYTRRSLLV